MLEQAAHLGFMDVSDLDDAQRCYGEMLGLELHDARPVALVHDTGVGQWRITLVEHVVVAPYTVFGWMVVATEGEIDRLTARGVSFNCYDGMVQEDRGVWTSPSGARIAWSHDSDGNNLSLQA